jgi:HEAT repeat protein
MHAAKALGRIKDPGSIQSLIPLLQDRVKAVREEASIALTVMGEAAIPALIESLTHQDWSVRLHAVESLGKTKSRMAVDPLLAVLVHDGDPAVREDAIRALGEIGDPQAVEALLIVMKEPGLRTAAVEALGRIGDRRVVPMLIGMVTGGTPPEVTRAVDGCGDQWSEEVAIQAAAVQALGEIGDESALPTLVAALEPTFTRAEAAAALARFGSKAIPFLLPLLSRTGDENVRYHVKETLALVGWRPSGDRR